MSTRTRAVSVLFEEGEYSGLVRKAMELTLSEGRRVSVAELVRRATLKVYADALENATTSEG
jgi:hypothetical protein